ncbi:YkgJ family cysteine cluster protein [Flavobacteriales bacterium]|nr:YkgJ family cysteine cluster protein [Flavobacteriales bacterium]
MLWSAKHRKAIKKQFIRWKKQPPKTLDQDFQENHDAVFETVDCLACGHCCKTTSPIFKERDIQRIAKAQRMSISRFSQQYLKRDDEGDWVLKSAPCAFLEEDTNACSIYDVRPQACREYPHTDRKNMAGILNLTEQNAHLCPAVSSIVQRMMDLTENT